MKAIFLFIALITLSKTSFSQTIKAIPSDAPVVFVRVEIPPKFPGGDSAWKAYLQKNLDPTIPGKNGAPKGTYIVVVKFIVSKDSSISDVSTENMPGYGLEAEATRLIKTGPKWIPALQNGHIVNAYMRQPITFVAK